MMRNMKMRITKCFPPSHIHMTLETCYVLALFMQQNDFVIVIMCAPFCIALFPILTVTVIAADFMAFIQSFEFTLKLPGFNSYGRLTEIARYYQNVVAANETENEHSHTSMRDDEHEHWTHSIPTTALHITLSKCVISLWLFQCSKMFRSLHSNWCRFYVSLGSGILWWKLFFSPTFCVNTAQILHWKFASGNHLLRFWTE